MFGYICPCGHTDQAADEETLLRRTWTHAGVCSAEEHAEARAADVGYGDPVDFFYEEAS